MYFYKYGSIVKNEAAARIVPIDALKSCWGLWMMKARMAAESDISTIFIMHQEIVKSSPLTFQIQVKERLELLVSIMLYNVDQFYYYIEWAGCIWFQTVLYRQHRRNSISQRKWLQNTAEIRTNSGALLLRRIDQSLCCTSTFSLLVTFREWRIMQCWISFGLSGWSISQVLLHAKGIETHKKPRQIKDVSGCRVELTM